MTNAMPPLQMMIKLSYGWRPLPLPRTQMYKFAKNVRRNRKNAAIAPFIVCKNNMVPPGGASPSPTAESSFVQLVCILQQALSIRRNNIM